MSPNCISAYISHQITEPLCPLILYQLAYPPYYTLYVPSFSFSEHIPPYYRTFMSPHSISANISHHTREHICPLILFQLAYPTILQNLYVRICISAGISHHTTEPLCPLILFQLGYPFILQNLYVPSFCFSLNIPHYRISMSPHSISAGIPPTLQNLYVP
jgi:hypothetical protein